MKKINKNESGFGAVEAGIVIVVLIVIGLVAYVIYSPIHDRNKIANNYSKIRLPTYLRLISKTSSGDGVDSYVGYTYIYSSTKASLGTLNDVASSVENQGFSPAKGTSIGQGILIEQDSQNNLSLDIESHQPYKLSIVVTNIQQ